MPVHNAPLSSHLCLHGLSRFCLSRDASQSLLTGLGMCRLTIFVSRDALRLTSSGLVLAQEVFHNTSCRVTQCCSNPFPSRYMDRLALPSSELHLYVTPLTAHRLFTASLIIAIKFIAEKPPSVFNDR